MQPDEQWGPPQSGGLGMEWEDGWEHEDTEGWEEGSFESEVTRQGGDDARGHFVASMSRVGFKFGTAVRICGLRGSQEHNGKQGKIVGFDHQALRLQVLLDGEQKTLSVKGCNLERLSGRPVAAHGHEDGGGSTLARGGVGLVLKLVVRSGENVLMVKSITEGSPAQSCGRINVGDCLVSVDGAPVDTIYKASDAILG